jgi:hypothetical protein
MGNKDRRRICGETVCEDTLYPQVCGFDFVDCSAAGGSHEGGGFTDTYFFNCSADDAFISKFCFELCDIRSCVFNTLSMSEGELIFSTITGCDFKDCSFNAITFEETTFADCTFTNCTFTDCIFDLNNDTKTVVFDTCSILKCFINDCVFMNKHLDGRLCDVKGFLSSLNDRLFHKTNCHGTKMKHSEVIVNSKKGRRGSNKNNRRQKEMSFRGGDYNHPFGVIPTVGGNHKNYVYDDLYSDDALSGVWGLGLDHFRNLHHGNHTPKSEDKHSRKAYLFCSEDL